MGSPAFWTGTVTSSLLDGVLKTVAGRPAGLLHPAMASPAMTDPPRRRRRSLYPVPRRRRRLAPLLALPLLLVMLLLSVGVLASCFPTASLPGSARSFPADSLVYDRAGHLIADLHRPGETRIPVP